MTDKFEDQINKFLESNILTKRLGFWMDHSILPVGKVMIGYVIGMGLVVLWNKDVTINFLGTQANLAQTMASFLVVFAFGFVGYAVLSLFADLADYKDKDQKLISEPEQLLLRQIERCNVAGSAEDSINYNGCVDTLIHMVPRKVMNSVANRRNEYIRNEEMPVFKYANGIPVGTLDKPVKLEDGTLFSPVTEKVQFVDYRKLFSITMEELENENLTWKRSEL